MLITKKQSVLWFYSTMLWQCYFNFFYQQFLVFLFPNNKGKNSKVQQWRYFLFFLSFFSKNRLCYDNFTLDQKIASAKSFFLVNSVGDLLPRRKHLARQYRYFFTVISIVCKVFCKVFPVFISSLKSVLRDIFCTSNQQTFTCIKPATETLEQSFKYVPS